jgi:hypothetical protein
VELTSEEVSERLRAVRERIAGAAARSGRAPEDVTLVGVSKRKPASLIVAAVRAGLRHIGESYVQEALSKLPEARTELEGAGVDPPRCHFVGGLQSNKARDAVQLFDVIRASSRVAPRRGGAACRSSCRWISRVRPARAGSPRPTSRLCSIAAPRCPVSPWTGS